MSTRIIPGLSAVVLLLFGLSAHAVERILAYHSEIVVAADASMTVTETIRVVAQGENIRRGIYRDFPTRYRDKLGNEYRVDFEPVGVTRDGMPEAWHTKALSNGLRVYAGSADTDLVPGEYTYTFSYTTDRQIGYFDDGDELYWNVTGNGWAFAIGQASATVTLPGNVTHGDISMEGYTGRSGETSQNYQSVVRSGAASIYSTQPLAAHEGLTLVMRWPKGVVVEPDDLDRLGYLLSDNRGLFLALIALALNVVYLGVVWTRYGRDPQPGVIFPHYAPPKGYSPAAARYISVMGYDDKTLTAAVINLAVKGHLSITSAQGDYTLKRLSSDSALAPGEEVLLNRLFNRGAVLVLDKKNHSAIGAARSAHRKALKRDYRNIYFRKNTGLLLPSILGSVLFFILIAVLRGVVPMVIAVYAVVLFLHILLLFLLKAPTGRGRVLLDRLEGFKLFLEVAEKDDLNLRNPPAMTPQLFEQFLPFAIALGVEQEWSEQFARVFAALNATEGSAYHPHWYHGEFSHRRMAQFSSSVGRNFSSAISSAARPPGSSSGSGGGGSSGGGGGGGGGGGW